MYKSIKVIIFLIAITINTLGSPTKYHSDKTVIMTEIECNSNGIKKACNTNAYLYNDFQADGAYVGLSEALKFEVSLAAIYSRGASANYIGDFQVASNIDASTDLLIYTGTVGYEFTGLHNLNATAGLIDLNSIYDVTDSSGYLINSSFGISAALSANGAFSIYPKPGYALNLSMDYDSDKFNMGLFDANPTKRSNPFSDGIFSIGQWKHFFNTNTNMQVGGWISSTSTGYTHGLYLNAEHHIEDTATLFARLATSSGVATVVPLGFEIGCLTGVPFSDKKDDLFSIGIAQARFDSGSYETTYEITYQRVQHEWLTLQPDIQYIQNLSGISNKNAIVATMRVIFNF
ncbi:MAG TPA: hypothetical protein ENK68_00610 [Epsilonproteobacteria bacterium]|nr:hypothetical protein [Campylobacterota bacterium]